MICRLTILLLIVGCVTKTFNNTESSETQVTKELMEEAIEKKYS